MASEVRCRWLPVLLLLLGSAACAAQETRARRDYPPAEMFRNYALSSCLADAVQGAGVKADAAAAAAGYLELGAGPLEAYTQATELGREFLARSYEGSRDVPYNTMKCIDLLHSPELQALVDRYFPAQP